MPGACESEIAIDVPVHAVSHSLQVLACTNVHAVGHSPSLTQALARMRVCHCVSASLITAVNLDIPFFHKRPRARGEGYL